MKQSVTDPQIADQLLIQSSDIEQMFVSLFDTMLMLPVETAESGSTPNLEFLTASIEVTGDWNAEFHVAVDQPLSQNIAAAMFGLEAEELSDDEVLDALCEVVNVVGGNIKGVVDQECSLSLPRVSNLQWKQDWNGTFVNFQCENNQMVALLQVK